jgi:FkbM family methyltransferase
MRLLRRLFYYFGSLFRIILNFERWPSVLYSLFFRDKDKTKIVKLRFPLLEFITRGGMDIWSIKETVLDCFYTRYSVPIQNGWYVLDVGAGIGDFSLYAAYGNPNTKVFAYEPFLESYQLLVRNINLNGFENIQPVHSALWRESGILQLDISGGEPLQIMSIDPGEDVDVQGAAKVKAISLAGVFDQHGIDHFDIIKLDCEGAEYEILMDTSSEVFKKIDRIIMEYHDIDETYHHKQLASFLKGMDYEVFCYDNFVHENIGYLYAEHMAIN